MSKLYRGVLFFFYFVLANSLSAQVVLDAGRVDAIDLASEEFYFKEDGTYNKLDIHFDFNPTADKGYEWDVDYQMTFDDEVQQPDILYVKDITLLQPSQFERLFDGKKYTVYKDDRVMVELMKLNNDHFALLTSEFKDEETAVSRMLKGKWQLADVELTPYFYMKVGDRYIVSLCSASPRYVIPVGNRLLFTKIQHYQEDVVYSKPGSVKKSDITHLLSEVSIENGPGYRVEKVHNGYALLNSFKERVLPHSYDSIRISDRFISTVKNGRSMAYNLLLDSLPCSYDSLQLTYSYVFAYNGNRLTIYNTQLDKLDIKDLRAAYPHGTSSLEVIVGNRHYWYGFGKLTQHPIPVFISDLYDLIVSSEYFSWEDGGSTLRVGSSQPVEYVFHASNNPYDSVFFRNGSTMWHETNLYMVADYVDSMLLIVEKDGKRGAATASVDRQDFTLQPSRRGKSIREYKLSFVEVLSPTFEQVEAYTDNLLAFCKDGMLGLYPFTTEVRYLKLGKRAGSFVRFTLPSGKEGWLSLADGKEYVDVK